MGFGPLQSGMRDSVPTTVPLARPFSQVGGVDYVSISSLLKLLLCRAKSSAGTAPTRPSPEFDSEYDITRPCGRHEVGLILRRRLEFGLFVFETVFAGGGRSRGCQIYSRRQMAKSFRISLVVGLQHLVMARLKRVDLVWGYRSSISPFEFALR